MARLARVIVPGLPQHVTQRGNRREPILFEEGDQEIYRDLLGEQVKRRGVEVWACCLMPNHVHLILAPGDELGLGLAGDYGDTVRNRRHHPLLSRGIGSRSMARLARVVIPGLAHHVTQRGNYRQPVFFGDDDYRAYLSLISAAAKGSETAIWAYCLMPNHVHFIMVPSDADGLRRTFAEAHRRYAARIHARLKVTGHLWQGRFSSTAMDERHLMAAARYVPMNPVRAGLVDRAEAWPWSSARAHLAGSDDGVVTVGPLLDRIEDFAGLLAAAEDEAAVLAIRRSRSTGRPVGAADWIAALEAKTRRSLAPAKRGPRPRTPADLQSDLFPTVSL
ncbi:transposase [Phenylobacterium sp.]|jgi:putative transposase|uniref:transposase n=1 Tax=Phenylobacterium sp. TaxID=1871053 RepID=UPI002E3601CA|nr:transposase [Phenylobacterium sp.]HEX3365617.1 transposase [Phenylobacterium sp.]